VSGDTVVVGASEATHVFVRSGTRWSRQAYLRASNAAANDWFGISVAMSGDTAVVAAWLEDSNATGVNGPQGNNLATQSGAAYVFTGLGLGIFPDGGGGYSVRFKDVPGLTYRMERAHVVTGPWDSIATILATELGLIAYHDTNAPPDHAFYRTARP